MMRETTRWSSCCRNFVVAMLLLSAIGVESQPRERLETVNGCSYSGAASPSNVLTFASDEEATNAVRQIVEASGLVQNFEIRAAGVNNAAAAIDGGKRYLLYNQSFMRDLREKTGTRWAALSVMAHEIGHHLNNHTLEPKRDPKYEIEADYFSGFWLQKIGAELAEAQAALQYLPEMQSDTHPPKHDRLAAVASGWTKSCESAPNCRSGDEPEAGDRDESRVETINGPETTDTQGTRTRRSEADSCEYAFDDECDEPDLCPRGTDTTDCKKSSERGPNSCEYAYDGVCDEPDLCRRGTDSADCDEPRRQQSPLYCCDGWGNRWCQLLQPGPLGGPCYCVGVVGTGRICR